MVLWKSNLIKKKNSKGSNTKIHIVTQYYFFNYFVQFLILYEITLDNKTKHVCFLEASLEVVSVSYSYKLLPNSKNIWYIIKIWYVYGIVCYTIQDFREVHYATNATVTDPFIWYGGKVVPWDKTVYAEVRKISEVPWPRFSLDTI